MKKLLPLLTVITLVTTAFVWQTTPQAPQHPPVKPIESKREFNLFDRSAQAAENRKDVDVLLRTPISSLPYILSEDKMKQPLHKLRTGADAAITDLANDERGMFSRAPMLRYEYVAHLRVANNDLIIYRTANSYSEDIYPVHYKIATIDTARNLVDEVAFAGMASPLAFCEGSVNPDGFITSTDYHQVWLNDPRKAGYANNKVISRTRAEVRYQRITPDGKIEAVKENKAVVQTN